VKPSVPLGNVSGSASARRLSASVGSVPERHSLASVTPSPSSSPRPVNPAAAEPKKAFSQKSLSEFRFTSGKR
jgi:hypothetical protein